MSLSAREYKIVRPTGRGELFFIDSLLHRGGDGPSDTMHPRGGDGLSGATYPRGGDVISDDRHLCGSHWVHVIPPSEARVRESLWEAT